MIYGEPVKLTFRNRMALAWALLWNRRWEIVAYLDRTTRLDLQYLIEAEGKSGARLFHAERTPTVFVPGLWEAGGERLVRLLPVGGDTDVVVLRLRLL